MRNQLLAVILLLSTITLKLHAQNFTGYRNNASSGVISVLANPANIADSRYTWDFNLVSVNAFAGYNSNFKLNELLRTKNENVSTQFLNGRQNTSAGLNVEVLGPSAMFKISKNATVAFTTRSRVIANIKNFDNRILNAVFNPSASNYPYTLNSNANSRKITNGWTEIGGSYAREILHKGNHSFKGGVTIKYLSGAGNNFLQVNKLKTTINVLNAKGPYLQNSSADIAIGNSGNNLYNPALNKLFGTGNNGVGADIGFTYEYQPAHLAGRYNYNDVPQYKFKAALSLLDIGAIKYKTILTESESFRMHIDASGKFFVAALKNQNTKQIKKLLDKNPAYFTPVINSLNKSYQASLPTVLQGDLDYRLKSNFFIAASAQLNLVDKNSTTSASQYNSIIIAPRYEGKKTSISLPINYNELSHFNAGVSLRSGSVFIGSGSLFSAMAKGKQADVYIGFHVAILSGATKPAGHLLAN